MWVDVMKFKEQKKLKAITLSYDDGVVQDIRFIRLLNRHNLKCTFNLNSGLLGKPQLFPHHGGYIAHYYVHSEDVRRVYEGHEIAVHTLTHPNLTALDEEEIIRQVEQDRLRLSELAGYEVVGMAYPCGGVNNDDRVAKIIRENTGVKYSRTITNTGNFDQQDNLYRFNPSVYHVGNFDQLMKMGQRFLDLKPDEPQIFYIWGHSYGLDYESDYWPKIEAFFELISNHDDIFYGTNAEVLL